MKPTKKTSRRTKRKSAKKKPVEKKAEPIKAASPVEQDFEAKKNVVPHPTVGPRVLEFEKQLDAQISGDGTQPEKRGRGRPRKDAQPADVTADVPLDVVEGAIKMPFELWSISQSVEQLALTEKESAQLAAAVKPLLDYYFPKIPQIAYAWAGLTVTSFWIVRSRLILIATVRALRNAAAEMNTTPSTPAPQAKGNKFPNVKDLKMQSV